MIVMPASAGVVLAIILLVVFSKQIGSLFTVLLMAMLLVVTPVITFIIGALAPIVFGPLGLLGVVYGVLLVFRSQTWNNGVLKSGWALLYLFALFGGFLYGAYYAFQQGCTVWCLGQVH